MLAFYPSPLPQEVFLHLILVQQYDNTIQKLKSVINL